MDAFNEFSFDLGHDVCLIVRVVIEPGRVAGSYPLGGGPVEIEEIWDFLTDAVNHFKYHRDKLKEVQYSGGPFRKDVESVGKIWGACEISCAKEGQTAAAFVEAVIHAYTSAHMIVDLVNQHRAWEKIAKKEGGYVKELYDMIFMPNGQLLALKAELARPVRIPPRSKQV